MLAGRAIRPGGDSRQRARAIAGLLGSRGRGRRRAPSRRPNRQQLPRIPGKTVQWRWCWCWESVWVGRASAVSAGRAVQSAVQSSSLRCPSFLPVALRRPSTLPCTAKPRGRRGNGGRCWRGCCEGAYVDGRGVHASTSELDDGPAASRERADLRVTAVGVPVGVL